MLRQAPTVIGRAKTKQQYSHYLNYVSYVLHSYSCHVEHIISLFSTQFGA